MAKLTQVTILLGSGRHKEARLMIRRAFESHLKRKDVLVALGARSFSVLRGWLRQIEEAGLEDPRKGLKIARAGGRVAVFAGNGVSTTASQHAAAVAKRRSGKKLREIAAELGVSESTASRRVRGVSRRAPGGASAKASAKGA